MITKKVALILPYNDELEILFQNRKNITKPGNKDYGFFGGHLEEGETIEQALAREIKEELELDVNNLEELRFFKGYTSSEELNVIRERHVFLCKMPDLKKIKVHEGKAEVFNINEAIKLNISDMDKRILSEVLEEITKKNG